MELTARTLIPFPREQVFGTYRDRLTDLVPYLPNVRAIETQRRTDEGPVARLHNEWTANYEIPAVARGFISPEQLRWQDIAEWRQDDWVCLWRIDLPAFPGLLECDGRTEFRQTPEGTDMDLRGRLVLHLEKARVPRLLAGTVRPVVERIVVGALGPNLVSTGDGVGRFLAAQAGERRA